MTPDRTSSLPGTAAGGALYLIINILFLGMMISLSLFVLWMEGSVDWIIARRSDDIAIHAVLKPVITDAQAEAFARRLREERPTLNVEVLLKQNAPAMLALQEPWMKNIGDVEIGEMPAVIVVRPPDVLTDPHKARAIADDLETRAEVDFIVFNLNGFDQLAGAAEAFARYANMGLAFVLAICGAAFILFNFGTSALKARCSPTKAIVRACFIFIGGTSGGYTGFKVLANYTSQHIYPLPAIPGRTYVVLLVITAVLCVLFELKDVRLKSRVAPAA